MKTLLKNARILTLVNDEIIEGDILITDNRIAKIEKDIKEKADKVIDCEGNLLMPGFKNVHAHTAMIFARSYADDLPLHEWLFDKIFPLENKFIDGDIYHLTKVGILEYLTSGITFAFDMYFHTEEIRKACEEMGFRTTILFTSLNDKLDFMEKKILSNKRDKLVNYCLGIHAEYTTPIERIREIAALAHKIKTPVFTHVGETESEVQGCVERYGKTPLKLMIEEGLFDYGGGGFHCNYFTDEEIELAKKHNFNIVTCPCSNLKLASGIAPIAKYQKAGLNIAIGTDGAASNNALDMFREMYLVSTLQKVTNKDAACMDGYDVLKMATLGGAKALGLDECDVLAPGKLADIIMIDLNNPAMQPLNNIKKNIVYTGSKDIVKMTMINGKVLYYNKEFFVGEDVNEIYRKAQEVTNRLKG